jgi:hypothetical protein
VSSGGGLRTVGRQSFCLTFILAALLTGCGGAQAAPTATPEPALPSPEPPTESPTGAPTVIPPTETPTDTPTPEPTATPTEVPTAVPTSLPAGFVLVPDVVGLPYRDARNAVLRAGLNFVYRDILDLDAEPGTVLGQDPPAGSGAPLNKLVFIYRSFVAPPALVGDTCYPLRLITTSGKLLFWVDLIEFVEYEIRTDFPYGMTTISDTQMLLLDDFDNEKKDFILFEAPFTATYVLSLGPYEIRQDDLDEHPGGLNVGCLYVIPEDEEQ